MAALDHSVGKKEALANAGILIAQSSNMLYEAIVCDCPILVADYGSLPHPLHLPRSGEDLKFSGPESLRTLLRRHLSGELLGVPRIQVAPHFPRATQGIVQRLLQLVTQLGL